LTFDQQLGRADLHMHTTASDGLPTAEKLLDHVARRNNLDVIAITDHDTLDASLWAYERRNSYPFDIVPGEEVSTAEGHVLALWIRERIPTNLSLAETSAAIHEQGGIAILAHPFHIHLSEVLHNFWRYLKRPEHLTESDINGLEVHNAGIVFPGCNLLARWLARKLNMAVTGSSDAHSLGAIGSGVTRFPGHSAADLRLALEQRLTVAKGKPWPLVEYLKMLHAASPLAATH
jgi:predicted metal-dependent phosphoesterase TrpH